MPFGLTNDPAIFKALINDILQDMLNHSCVCLFRQHPDFVPLHERTHTTYEVGVVNKLALENKLFLKTEECKFHSPAVKFLGYVVPQCQL